jgi:hypothetical protein
MRLSFPQFNHLTSRAMNRRPALAAFSNTDVMGRERDAACACKNLTE